MNEALPTDREIRINNLRKEIQAIILTDAEYHYRAENDELLPVRIAEGCGYKIGLLLRSYDLQNILGHKNK